MNLKLMFDRIKNIKTILTSFLLLSLSTFCISCSEGKHQTIEKGTSVEDALETLDKFGYAHGTQEYGLAWQPTNDEAFIFCKLDTDKTLVLVHKSTLIEELIVVVPPGTTASDLKGQKNRQRPTITPTSIHFSQDSYSLNFDK